MRVHYSSVPPVSVVHMLADERDSRLGVVRVEGGQVQIIDEEDHLGRTWRPVRIPRLFLQAGCHARLQDGSTADERWEGKRFGRNGLKASELSYQGTRIHLKTGEQAYICVP